MKELCQKSLIHTNNFNTKHKFERLNMSNSVLQRYTVSVPSIKRTSRSNQSSYRQTGDIRFNDHKRAKSHMNSFAQNSDYAKEENSRELSVNISFFINLIILTYLHFRTKR